MDDAGSASVLDRVELCWWCDCWDTATEAVAVCVDGRVVCDARALKALYDAAIDAPPTHRQTRTGFSPSTFAWICVCEGAKRGGAWNVRERGAFVLWRDDDDPLEIGARYVERWLDRWTPLWRLARMAAIDPAERPADEGV